MEWTGPLTSSLTRNALIAFVQQIFGFRTKRTRLRIYWSPTAPTSIEGTSEELREVSDAIEEIASRRRRNVKFSATVVGDPAPYVAFLKGLRIEFRPGLLHVEITSVRWLLIAGNETALRGAGSYFALPGSSANCSHTHLEWYDGHPLVKPDAAPLVISIRDYRILG